MNPNLPVPPASPTATDPPPARDPRWVNPYRRLPQLRWAVQLAYLAFLLLVGWNSRASSGR